MGPDGEGAPWFDDDWCCFGLLKDQFARPRADVLFEMHDHARERCFDLADETQVPVYWQFPSDARRTEYPLSAVIRFLGRDWFDSSIAYMLALAIYRRPPAIGFWGVHMESADEYAHQRDNLCWMIGLAEGRGIEIARPKDWPLLSHKATERYPHRYGYQS